MNNIFSFEEEVLINYIEGQVAEYGEGYVIIDNGGMGYEINISSTTLAKVSEVPFARIYTYLAVREDGVTLYGFYTKEEKNMFLKLISVGGIGPKGALTILSGVELTSLISCIVLGDTKTLSKVKGIGKKTAERIVLELKESIHAELADLPLTEEETAPTMSKDVEDAVFALRGLGIGRNEAVKAVQACKGQATSLEQLIKLALRML